MNTMMALADPTRKRIVEVLAERERSAGEIAAMFPMSAPAISQHLKVLRECGLVRVRVEGQRRMQTFNPAALDELEGWIARTRRFWNGRLNALERELRKEKNHE